MPFLLLLLLLLYYYITNKEKKNEKKEEKISFILPSHQKDKYLLKNKAKISNICLFNLFSNCYIIGLN